MPTRPATPTIVTVNGAQQPFMRAISVHRATGGAARDEATIEVDLSARGTGQQWIQNFAMNGQTGGDVQVWAYPGGTPQLLHAGTLVVPSIKIGENEERFHVTSRVEPWMFGAVMDGVYCWEPLSGQLVTILDECVFNPEIDGQVLPNQSAIGWLFGQAPVFLDPESARTAAAVALQGNAPIYWTLGSALAYLCWALNPAQTYLNNPSTLSFDLLPPWPLQNFQVTRGKFLSDYLDDILPRFGLGWYLDLSSGTPTIAFFVRGTGVSNSVYLGPPGSFYAGDNLVGADVHFDVGNVRNQAVVFGDWYYVEASFILYRAWKTGLDNTAEANLTKGTTAYESNPDYQRAWRDWVGNEAGDYNGLRPEITAPYNLAGLFNAATTPRRRRFLPTITLGSDQAPKGETGGVTVEWSVDSGATWRPLRTLEDPTCVVLEREMGIRFDGLVPPAELRRAGTKARVRVTATVRSDVRLGNVQGPYPTSPLGGIAPFQLDESEKFHWRVVHPTSIYYAGVLNGSYPSNRADDTLALAAYTAFLQAVFDIADAQGRVEIEGLDTTGQAGQYDLGQLLASINGRQIDFNAQSFGSGEARFPQIVGITYDCQRQRCTLHLETYRDPGRFTEWDAARTQQRIALVEKKQRRSKKEHWAGKGGGF
ncbi:MAG TPA: hypothetical protein VG826_29265 [Pirellulales bacterium]|nr:hypothetical protein [Pirellulales bacterium]